MLAIRTMTATDAPVALAVTKQAGWNQGETDWRRFLGMEPDGCFVAEMDGEPVGTTVTCVFGAVAWIGMVLVDKRARRRGVATCLLRVQAATAIPGPCLGGLARVEMAPEAAQLALTAQHPLQQRGDAGMSHQRL